MLRAFHSEVEGITDGQSKVIYAVFPPWPDIAFFCAFNSLLKQVLQFFHLAWISFRETNGKIATTYFFKFNTFNLNFQIYFNFNNE